ncbi:MAG TPA: Gfo/Idh/MocA family oxidoreductase, partial [Deinococcales bacterium]|nr:Gfo/Idh/MocA family oxidoreductase [Deinococcales bacterium]
MIPTNPEDRPTPALAGASGEFPAPAPGVEPSLPNGETAPRANGETAPRSNGEIPIPPGLAVAGAGTAGTAGLDAYARSGLVRVLAAADENAERARKALDGRGVPLRKLPEILADEAVRLVHVATPPSLHARQAIAA